MTTNQNEEEVNKIPNFDNSESEFGALISDSEKEKRHLKSLNEIPVRNFCPAISFTSEECAKVDQLLRIDRESMIAFGDTLRERNRVTYLT